MRIAVLGLAIVLSVFARLPAQESSEGFRDDDGFAVVQFAENDDSMDIQSGRLNGLDPRTVGGGTTTYYALTLGAGFKVTDSLLIQTELRADFAGDGTPFDDSKDGELFTVGVAVLWKF